MAVPVGGTKEEVDDAAGGEKEDAKGRGIATGRDEECRPQNIQLELEERLSWLQCLHVQEDGAWHFLQEVCLATLEWPHASHRHRPVGARLVN